MGFVSGITPAQGSAHGSLAPRADAEVTLSNNSADTPDLPWISRLGFVTVPDAAPLPRLGEVFFDVRGESRTLRLSWYADTGIAVFSIWRAGRCTGTFRLPLADLPRMIEILERGPAQPGRERPPDTGALQAGLAARGPAAGDGTALFPAPGQDDGYGTGQGRDAYLTAAGGVRTPGYLAAEYPAADAPSGYPAADAASGYPAPGDPAGPAYRAPGYPPGGDGAAGRGSYAGGGMPETGRPDGRVPPGPGGPHPGSDHDRQAGEGFAPSYARADPELYRNDRPARNPGHPNGLGDSGYPADPAPVLPSEQFPGPRRTRQPYYGDGDYRRQ